MSLSNIDYGTLEALKEFKVFFDMVQNPSKYAEVVKQAEAVLDEMSKVVNAFTTVNEANEYLSKSKAHAAEVVKELEEKEVVFTNKVKEAQDSLDKRRKELDEKSSEVSAEAKKVEDSKKELSERLYLYEVSTAELQKKQEELLAKQQELLDKEKELNKKAAQLKAILGA